MGLMFPDDLDAWKRWQASRHRLRRLRHAFDRPTPPHLVLHVREDADDPVVLFAVDATTPAAVAATTAPLAFLADVPVAVVAPGDVSSRLPGGWAAAPVDGDLDTPAPDVARGIRAVVAMGEFLPAGAAACAWARRAGATVFVVQHGLLAPQAPPLPRDAHLLAFTDRDGAFWADGRPDVTAEAIGSHLLWQASQAPAPVVDPAASPVFLGQLHGAELPRRTSAATAQAFCLMTGGVYRPHPAETDRLSRRQHAAWRRRGIRIDAGGPLREVRRPVVSIFSTGVLEAAALGIPSFVTCVRPPGWVREFWERYDMALWGGAPTPALTLPENDPAEAVAARVRRAAEGAA